MTNAVSHVTTKVRLMHFNRITGRRFRKQSNDTFKVLFGIIDDALSNIRSDKQIVTQKMAAYTCIYNCFICQETMIVSKQFMSLLIRCVALGYVKLNHSRECDVYHSFLISAFQYPIRQQTNRTMTTWTKSFFDITLTIDLILSDLKPTLVLFETFQDQISILGTTYQLNPDCMQLIKGHLLHVTV